MFITIEMDEECVLYTPYGILFSHKGKNMSFSGKWMGLKGSDKLSKSLLEKQILLVFDSNAKFRICVYLGHTNRRRLLEQKRGSGKREDNKIKAV